MTSSVRVHLDYLLHTECHGNDDLVLNERVEYNIQIIAAFLYLQYPRNTSCSIILLDAADAVVCNKQQDINNHFIRYLPISIRLERDLNGLL